MNGPLDDTSAATAVVTTDTSPKSSPRRPPPIKPDIPCYVPSTKDELFKTTEKICQRILTHRQNLSLSKHEFQVMDLRKIKFMFSKKAIKFEEIFTVDLTSTT